jgi:pyrroline-5-carboxylate reductase
VGVGAVAVGVGAVAVLLEQEEEAKYLTHVKNLLRIIGRVIKISKTTINFVLYIRLSIRLSVRIEQLSYH